MEQLMSASMSSNGQIVIPEKIRKLLKLKTGAKFVVLCQGDTVLLKMLRPPVPRLEDLDELIRDAQKKAKKAGITKAAVKAAILQARKKA